MSNNIYDILGKLDGLTPKANPVSTAEPIYESVDPRGDIMSAVTQLEERFMGFKEAKAKRKEPEAVIPATDLTRSADPDVARLATKAKFIKPELNDFEAIVSYTSKLEKELEQAEQADVVDRQKIEQTQGMLTKTQANQDALRKVIDNTDQRFRALNAKVASGQVTQQDQKAAQAAQQIEKDADAAKAAIAKNALAPEQPTTAPEVPQDTNVYKFPGAETPAQGSGLDVNKSQQDITATNLSAAERLATDANKVGNVTAVPGEVEKKAINFESIAEDSPKLEKSTITTPTTAEEFAQANIEAIQRVRADKNMPRVKLVFPNSTQVKPRADIDAFVKRLDKEFPKSNPKQRNAQIYQILSNADVFAKFVDVATTAPNVYYFYNVGKDTAKAYHLGLKQSQSGRFYSLGKPNEWAEQAFGPGKKWIPPSAAQEELPMTLESQESLGKNTMTKPTSIIEAVRSVEDKKLREAAKPDFLDLDKDGDTDEPMKSAAKSAKDHEPAKPDSDAVAKRKRLQALKDKQEDERAEKGDDDKSASRFVKGRAYGGSAQKDDEDKDELEEGKFKEIYTDMMDQATKKGYSSHKQFTPADYDELGKKHNISGKELAVALGHKKVSDVGESGLQAYLGKKKYGKEGMSALQQAGRDGASKEKMAIIRAKHDKFNESAKPDFLDVDKDGNKKEAFKKAVKDKKEVEEGIKFGDTIKNSAGKMTKAKVTVKEGKDAIRNHPIYTTKEAWDHYAEELAEQEMMEQSMMEAPLVNVQQELDEIAKLAGLAPKMEAKSVCPSCKCEKCECNENLAPMAPADSASPLTHTLEGMGCTMEELEEAASRKDFRRVADRIANMKDRIEAAKMGHAFADDFQQANPRFKRKMFLTACGLDEAACNMESQPAAMMVGEADMEEGNEFSGALAAAKASGSKDFEVDGKKYTVKEDININVSASGEEDAVNLIRKLSGMPVIAIQAAPAEEACGACGSSPCGCEETVAEAGPKERDIEYTNTPREETAGTDAAIPSGGDLNRAKKQYRKEYPGDNPMAVKEAIQNMLWNDYQSMIDDVKA